MTQSNSGIAFMDHLKRAARTTLSIYLDGETGVGKELLAQAIHSCSTRSSAPFIPLHCGGLTPSLAESELFGHVKGAFTGAHTSRLGALMQAHQGTLFLDEVADLSPAIQVKLLRFLESGEIRAVGSDHLRYSQTRLICATHVSLPDLVKKGAFRKDLYFRLASITLSVPPLRERKDDITLLAQHFARENGVSILPSALERLGKHVWEGNVRELKHAIERATAFLPPQQLHLSEIDFNFLNDLPRILPEVEISNRDLSHKEKPIYLSSEKLSDYEWRGIQETLLKFNGNKSKTAKQLGIARSTLFEKLKKYRTNSERIAEKTLQAPVHAAPLNLSTHSI